MNLIFFFETESAGDEASMICVSFNIRYTSSLDLSEHGDIVTIRNSESEGLWIWERTKRRRTELTWYFRPYPMPDDPPCMAAADALPDYTTTIFVDLLHATQPRAYNTDW